MPFVKVDTAILDSSVWMPRDLRSLFLTALFMAKPHELKEPTPQLKVRTLEETGWEVPAGEYGLIEAAATRIIERDGMELEHGYTVLEALGERDNDSKNPDYDGRRVVRVRGGYIVLNFRLYRDKDYTAAQRQRRMRERRKSEQDEEPSGLPGITVPSRSHAVTSRDVTQAEAEAEVEAVKTSSVVEERSPPRVPHIPTDISTPDAGTRARELTVMLNKGMRNNPKIGERYNPVVSSSGPSLKAAEDLQAAGVEHGFAKDVTYRIALIYDPRKLGDQIQSLAYVVPAVISAWEQEGEKRAALAAQSPSGGPGDPSPTPSTSNGTGPGKGTRTGGNRTGDLKGEGIIVYGRIRDGIRTEIKDNPNDSGNHLEVIISPAVAAELSSPAKTALAAIGGPSAINRSTDESLSWKFAAAYAAAVTGNG